MSSRVISLSLSLFLSSQAPAGELGSRDPPSSVDLADVARLACCSLQYTRVIKYGGLGVDLARPADQDLYLTQLPSYEYRDLVTTAPSDSSLAHGFSCTLHRSIRIRIRRVIERYLTHT